MKVFSDNKDNLDKAMNWIKGIVAAAGSRRDYEGTVKSIMPFGAFVEFMPGKQGLLHISEVSWSRLDSARRRDEGRRQGKDQAHWYRSEDRQAAPEPQGPDGEAEGYVEPEARAASAANAVVPAESDGDGPWWRTPRWR